MSEGTMNTLSKPDIQLPTAFEPKGAKKRVAKADAVIAYAKQVQDWDLFDRAIAAKIDDWRQLEAWWTDNVSGRKDAGSKSNADRRSTVSLAKAEDLTGFSQQQIHRVRQALEDLERFVAKIRGNERRDLYVDPADNFRALGTGENDWHTPDDILDLARAVLGVIDLDPASSDKAQLSVQAKEYFTAEDSDLDKEWYGRVWLNPPYAAPLIRQFVSKLVNEYQSGRVSAAIMLTHNYTDAAWFHVAAPAAEAVCFLRRRVKFIDAFGKEASPTQGQVLFYFGEDEQRFIEVVQPHGLVMRHV
jgi:phage N-6-adenine-methyltransferase